MQLGSKLNSFIDFLREEFFQKQILILGFGKEGQSTFKLLTEYLPEVEILIADGDASLIEMQVLENADRTALYLGEGYLDAISYADVIIKSPGVKMPFKSSQKSKSITSQTDLFLRFYKSQVVGVTGTKGKSTTATLIQHILKESNKESVLLGNIGLPCFDMVGRITEKSIVVFELSAHQLEFVTVSPHIAVLLNIFPEHLDYFESVERYKAAKENIFRFQTKRDYLVVHKTLKDLSGDFDATCLYFDSSQNSIEDSTETPLLGKHNLQNILASILVVELFGISKTDASQSLLDFKPLPHRLEYVGKFKGVDFYNDSISTIPESAIAAIESLKKVDTVILGGFDRGLDYSKLVTYLATSDISNFIFLGKAGEAIRIQLEKIKKTNFNLIQVLTLDEAFPIIVEKTKPGYICLLSPAASSYDQFHNFEHRGDAFKKLARSLGK